MRSLWILITAATLLADPSIPAGLWRNREEGFVIRIQACGAGFCGFAAGAPPGKEKKPQDVCGKQMLRDFVWSEKSRRWEGTMEPPGAATKLNAAISWDGKGNLTMKARLLLLSKTMSFVPFNGKIGQGCRLEPE
ncbi:MAG: DUF2147 domain-containing protein [Bryobacteraceae bacterium]|nr:DUF2147 domain-containing protein [Bryobacteraceae bacterium]